MLRSVWLLQEQERCFGRTTSVRGSLTLAVRAYVGDIRLGRRWWCCCACCCCCCFCKVSPRLWRVWGPRKLKSPQISPPPSCPSPTTLLLLVVKVDSVLLVLLLLPPPLTGLPAALYAVVLDDDPQLLHLQPKRQIEGEYKRNQWLLSKH